MLAFSVPSLGVGTVKTLMTQHILVTGGAGFIGSHLVDALVLHGYKVTVIDIITDLNRKHLNHFAYVINADLTQPKTIELIKRLKPDIIYHMAANASVAMSMQEPLLDLKLNYNVTADLLNVATQINVKLFVFASTGGGLSSEYTVLPTSEHLICKPLSPYAIHKLASEQLGEFYRMQGGLPFVALRFANVYGPRQTVTQGEANVIATFASRMQKNEMTQINGTGRQTRDYMYIDDAVAACLLLLEHQNILGPLNVGSGLETDVLTLHRLMAAYMDYTRKPVMHPALPGEQLRSCLDISKIRLLLEWTPKTTLAQGLAKTLEWTERTVRELAPHDKNLKIRA